MNGAGRYPKRLYDSVATELAAVRLSGWTEASMKPTSGAIIVAPKKNTNQRSKYTIYLLSQKGTGRHATQAKKPSRHARAYAFGELYPPM